MSAGSYSIIVRSRTGSCSVPPTPPNPVSIGIIVQCALLSIISPSQFPTGNVGVPYSYQVHTSGGESPFHFVIVEGALPPGLSMSTGGLINGTATAIGNFIFQIDVTDSCTTGVQSATAVFTISIQQQLYPPLTIITPVNLPDAELGKPYSFKLSTAGGEGAITFKLVSGSVPVGLNVNAGGLISGTANKIGAYTFIMSATDSCPTGAQVAQQTFILRIRTPALSIIALPSTFSVPAGLSSTKVITYQFTGESSVNTSLTSPEGVFRINGETIGTYPAPLTAVIQNGIGNVSEAVPIPVNIIEKALQLNNATVEISRSFNDDQMNFVKVVNVFFNITTEAAADFAITRVELYFTNHRPEITVERNYPRLQAFASIRTVGSGLLQGRWEVDGRVISIVNQFMIYAQSVILQTPLVPSLPTFDTGTHVVRFVVSNPAVQIELPSILYFVTAAESPVELFGIQLHSPVNGARLAYESTRFEWTKSDRMSLFLVQYYKQRDAEPFFSALTREGDYVMPDAVLNYLFLPGEQYYWKVMGYDEEGIMLGESTVYTYYFKE